MPPFLRPSIEHGLPPSRSVLTTKVWQRATALFVESLVGPPGRLPDDGEKMLSSSQVVPLLEESCKEEVRHAYAMAEEPSLHPAPPPFITLCSTRCLARERGMVHGSQPFRPCTVFSVLPTGPPVAAEDSPHSPPVWVSYRLRILCSRRTPC